MNWILDGVADVADRNREHVAALDAADEQADAEQATPRPATWRGKARAVNRNRTVAAWVGWIVFAVVFIGVKFLLWS
jgi:hypothetical protein